jgi:hypothetical protein
MKRWTAEPHGVRDAATLLPVVAAILLLPPFILLFATPVLIAGIPLIVVYVFGIWAAIVFCAWLLARTLPGTDAATGIEGEAEARSSPDRR